jgi:hypothetical protein
MTNSDNKIAEQMIRLMQADDSVNAPQDAVKWAKNVFRSRIAEPKTSIVHRVLAVLQMDLMPQKTAFGERSGAAAQARQMLFEAGEHGIDLRIREMKKTREIRGQIIGEGFVNSNLELSGDGKHYQATTTETSEFTFTGIAPGTYTLIAKNGDLELRIDGLNIT